MSCGSNLSSIPKPNTKYRGVWKVSLPSVMNTWNPAKLFMFYLAESKLSTIQSDWSLTVRWWFQCICYHSFFHCSFIFPAFLRVQKRRSNGDHHWVALGTGKTIPHLPFIEEVSPLYLQQRLSLNKASSLNRRNMFGIGVFVFSEKSFSWCSRV